MKSRKFKWGNPLFVAFLAIAGIFGVSATVIDKQVKEEALTEKAEASDNSTLHSNKVYIELQGDYGLTNCGGVFLHFWGSGVETIDVAGTVYTGAGSYKAGWAWYFMYDDAYIGKNCQFWIKWSNVGGNDAWCNKSTLIVPSATSGDRWAYIPWVDQTYSWSNRSFYRALTVDNGSTTVSVAGDFMGIQNEYSHTDMVFTVSGIPSNKYATLVQYSDPSCEVQTNEFLLTDNQKTISAGFKFTQDYRFKPKLYDALQVSVNGGSSWQKMSCSDPTSSTRTYTLSSVSLVSGNQVQFKMGDTLIYPNLNNYGMNIRRSGDSYYVHDTNSGNISISYSSGTYNINQFSTKGYLGNSCQYVIDISTGTYYRMEYFGADDSRKKQCIAPKGTASAHFIYINSGTKLYLVNTDGVASNSYYSPTADGGAAVQDGSYVTVSTSAYYYVELRSFTNKNEYDKLYLENYSVNVTFNYNGKGGTNYTSEVIRKLPFDEPSVSLVDGYHFDGWYDNSSFTGDAWDFSTDHIDSATTLYAKWTCGEEAAMDFVNAFNTDVGAKCVSHDTNTKDTFKTNWNGTHESNYNAIKNDDYITYWLDSSHGSTQANRDAVALMLSRYDYILKKYGYSEGDDDLHDFMGKTPTKLAIRDFSPLSLFGEEENLSTIIIIVASSLALLSVTALSILVIKKRKNKEE